MKLHEALSTGLAFRMHKNAGWWESSEHHIAMSRDMWSGRDVMSNDWQVRLPDGRIFDSYGQTMSVLSRLEKDENGNYTQESIDNLYGLKKAEASNTTADVDPSHGAWAKRTQEALKQEASNTLPTNLKDLIAAIATEDEKEMAEMFPVECECGSDAIGGGSHSTYCPKRSEG